MKRNKTITRGIKIHHHRVNTILSYVAQKMKGEGSCIMDLNSILLMSFFYACRLIRKTKLDGAHEKLCIKGSKEKKKENCDELVESCLCRDVTQLMGIHVRTSNFMGVLAT